MSAMSRLDGVWPSRDDYQAAVLHPERNLKDRRLHSMQVEMRKMGVLSAPYPRSGNFGAVYKFSNGRESYALKIFDKAQPDREQRYQLIDSHLKMQSSSASLVSFSYDQQGILVNGRRYPALVMQWVEGPTLDRYLSSIFRQGGQVDNRAMCQAWVDVVLDLARHQTAHGDLQHGNILVLPDGRFKLVDYDGMFVPAMRQAGLTAAEIGLPAYQHPKRYRGYFDERLDNFAALVILLSLAAVDGGRWQHYHTDDNCLIVRESDLLRPDQSPLINELAGSPDAPLRKLAMMLKLASKGSLDSIPPFTQVVADSTIKQLLSHQWRLTPSTMPSAGQNLSAGAGRESNDQLTLRQREVLMLVAEGLSDDQIAYRLSVQAKTVRDHISKIQQRAGAATRKDMIIWARAQGLVSTPSSVSQAIPMAAYNTPATYNPPVVHPTPALSYPAERQYQQAQVAVKPSIKSWAWILIIALVVGVGAIAYLNSRSSEKPGKPPIARGNEPRIESEITTDTVPPAPMLGAHRDAWVEANALINGYYYHVVRCRFQTRSPSASGIRIYGIKALALFHSKDGSRIIVRSSSYSIASGQIGVQGESSIVYRDRVTYYDIKLYLPASAVPAGTGHYAVIDIRSTDGDRLATYQTEPFDAR